LQQAVALIFRKDCYPERGKLIVSAAEQASYHADLSDRRSRHGTRAGSRMNKN